MLKLLNVVGARPQIIKAAAISREIKNNFTDKIQEVILHTGQHYDLEMSQVFFDEMGIPEPDFNLNVGSSSHAVQTANIIRGTEEILMREKPDFVLVYGDTNSTLAVALAAAKEHFKVVHVEAGLRSFNKSMPEEINRIVCDHVSTLLFTPTLKGLQNLEKEGFETNKESPYSIDNPGVFHCGDIMYDNSLHYSSISGGKTNLMEAFNLEPEGFILATIHRNLNTDNAERLKSIVTALIEISDLHQFKIVFPLHPRTKKSIETILDAGLCGKLKEHEGIILTKPLSFFEMIELEKNCKMVITDSGGVQKEAYFFKKPGIILRKETEWVEITECGAAKLVDADSKQILDAVGFYMLETGISYPSVFGDGKAANFICSKLLDSHDVD
jgi:UDP-GlcNAc3NAcA epimerase